MAIPLTPGDKNLLLGAVGEPATRDRIVELLELVGTGDVVGPAGATDNALVRFDGASGALIQNSLVTLSDLGALAGITSLSVNGPMLVADGTAAAPSYSFGSDPDNGLYRVGADSIGFSTAGINRGSINSSGGWSLGTTNTGTTHVVYGDIQFGEASATATVELYRAGTTGLMAVRGDASGTPSSVILYGSAHATKASDIELIANGGIVGAWDESVGNFYFPDILVGGTSDAWTGESAIPGIVQAFQPKIAGTSGTNNSVSAMQVAVLDGANNRRMNMWVDDLNATAGIIVGASSGMPTFHILMASVDAMSISPAGLITIGATGGVQNHVINGSLRISGTLGVGNAVAATTPGTVTNRIEVFDEAGVSLGFIAVYDAIT